MGKHIRADGDTWEAAIEPARGRGGAAALVFHCISNPQRPYRVVPVPAEAEGGAIDARARLESLELGALFERSQVMDFVHDPEADPRNIDPHTTP